jgi:hypothetical protein
VKALHTVIPAWKRRNLELVPLLLPSQLKAPPPPSSPPPTPTPTISLTASATTTP